MSLKIKILLPVFLIMGVVMGLIAVNIQIGTHFMIDSMEREIRQLIGLSIGESLEDFLFQQGVDDPERLRQRLMNSKLLETWLLVDENKSILEWHRDYFPAGITISDPASFDIPYEMIALKDGESVLVDLIDEALQTRSIRIRENYVAVPLSGVIPDSNGSEGREILWVLFGKTAPVSETLVGRRTEFYNALLWVMGLGTVLLLVIVFILLNRFVLRPIDGLIAEFHRVAHGDYDHEVRPLGRRDELDRMITDFNVMREKVQGHRDELQQKIEEVTAQVQKSERNLMLAQRMNALGALAAGLAHEINNPLGGMINAAHSLQRDTTQDGKTREYLELIREGLERIESIVRRTLVFGHQPERSGRFRFSALAAEAWELTKLRTPGRVVAFSCDVQPPNLEFSAGAGEFMQVFLNLFSNSLDAMPDGGTLQVQCMKKGEEIQVEVKDNGSGMTEEQVRSVFDFFYTTKEPGKGTGLGMGVVYHIIRSFDGTIDVKSRQGEGTIVRILLPF